MASRIICHHRINANTIYFDHHNGVRFKRKKNNSSIFKNKKDKKNKSQKICRENEPALRTQSIAY